MKRGDIVTIALQGDFGKPRPALIIQANLFNEQHATITVVLISSELVDAPIFRISLEPSKKNGLRLPCQIQVDKLMTIKRDKIGAVVGQLDDTVMTQLNRTLALWIGLA